MTLFTRSPLLQTQNAGTFTTLLLIVLVVVVIYFLVRYFLGRREHDAGAQDRHVASDRQDAANRIMQRKDPIETKTTGANTGPGSVKINTPTGEQLPVDTSLVSPAPQPNLDLHVSSTAPVAPSLETDPITDLGKDSVGGVVGDAPIAWGSDPTGVADAAAASAAAISVKEPGDTSTPLTDSLAPEAGAVLPTSGMAEVVSGRVPPAHADDLVMIEGIGPRIAELLNSMGVTSFSQLASMHPEDIRTILDGAGLRLADPASWPEQARLAAAGDTAGLQALQSRLKAGR